MSSSKRSNVPNAWDDDWEKLADAQESTPEPVAPPPPQILSRSARKAQHLEANKQLWETADTATEVPHFLQAERSSAASSPAPTQYTVPFRPAVKVLARKPPKPSSTPNGTTASPTVPSSSTQDKAENDSDSEAEAERQRALTFAERQAKTAEERKLKAERYAAARERIFGSSSTSPSPSTSKTDVTESKSSSRSNPGPKEQNQRKLWDPNDSAGSNMKKSPARLDGAPIREPKGPDSSGGFGRGRGRGRGRGTS